MSDPAEIIALFNGFAGRDIDPRDPADPVFTGMRSIAEQHKLKLEIHEENALLATDYNPARVRGYVIKILSDGSKNRRLKNFVAG